MSHEFIADNLRRLRTARSFTQEELAERAGVSLATCRNLEKGRTTPRVDTLRSIAEALDTTVAALLTKVERLENVRFRAGRRMNTREQILADCAAWLKDFNYLEEILGEQPESPLASLRKDVQATFRKTGSIPRCAKLAREAFDLDEEEPIRDICGLLEAHGVKINPIYARTEHFFGLSIGQDDGGPAIAVNTWERISVERRIFTAAHELGHLLLHHDAYDVQKTDENDKEEKQADEFAAHFLMPPRSFKKEWDETRGLPLIERVLKVKRIFRVSYKTVLYRLVPHYKGPGNLWGRFFGAWNKAYNYSLAKEKEREPEGLSDADFTETRLYWRVRAAVEREKITLSKAAKILGRSLREMRELSQSWVE